MQLTTIWYYKICDGVPISRAQRLLIRVCIGLLLPLAWLYCAMGRGRRWIYLRGWLPMQRLPVPVVVIGNLTVGGTGKTPLVLHLATRLRAQGWTPGILTRGYGGQSKTWPQWVTADSDPALVGDEPVVLARRSGCVVIAGPQRVASGAMAVHMGNCDIVLTDDGLQHYPLAREIEIALIDETRGLGNGHCLPAGPLRELPARLQTVDWVLHHGRDAHSQMWLRPGAVVNLRQPELTRPLAHWHGQRVLAVAGIGNPGRFFALLTAAGLDITPRPYPDHHRFTAADVAAWADAVVLMTEKDAVKCAAWARETHWFLTVDAVLDDDFLQQFDAKIATLRRPPSHPAPQICASERTAPIAANSIHSPKKPRKT